MAGEPRSEYGREASQDGRGPGHDDVDRARRSDAGRRPDEMLAMLADDDCLDLLGLMIEEGRPVSVGEVAETTGESATSVYRRLQAMAETSLVTRHTEVDTDGLAQPAYETWLVEHDGAIMDAVGAPTRGSGDPTY